MKSAIPLSVTAALGLAGCNHSVRKTNVYVFAAASLKESFTSIGQRFDLNQPENQIVLNFAGSQALALEIKQKADCQVFASADLRQMKIAETSGRIDPKDVQEFAENKLEIVATISSGVFKLSDLAKPGVKIVLADSAVPAGNYSLKMLDNVGAPFKQAVLNNVVSYEQDVRTVLTKIELGEADAGIVYRTDANVSRNIRQIAVPPQYEVTSKYYIAPLKGPEYQAAAEFVSAVTSSGGKRILIGKGFTVPGQPISHPVTGLSR